MKKNLLFAIVLLGLASLPGQAQVTAIKAGKLIDPETGAASINQIILVEGKQIQAVGAGLTIPAGAAVIDLSRSTVMPGLFDAHTHLCNLPVTLRGLGFGDLRDSFFQAITLNSTGYRALRGAANARSMLEAGFTTVRDLGHAGNYADTDLRRAIEEGLVPGPTIINSGRKISPYGGQFQLQPERRDLLAPDYIFADTRDEMVKAVRENIHYGAKVIKIIVAGQPYIYSVDDIKFIVAEAAKAGLKVAADCATRAGSRNAAEAGLASIEHGAGMTDEDYEVAKRNHVTLIINVPPETVWREGGIPVEMRRSYLDFLRRAYKLGVTLAYGTDVVFVTPGQNYGRMAISFIDTYLDAGIPAQAILRMMTTNAARLLGVEQERGAVKAGLAADLIATNENPLDNILTLKQVTFVMKEGKIYKQGP